VGARRVPRRTLWQLIERNRLHRAVIMIWFFVLWMLGVGGAVFMLTTGFQIQRSMWRLLSYWPENQPPLYWLPLYANLVVAACLGVAYVIWAARQPEFKVAQFFGARRPTQDEYSETRQALTEIALAAGLKPRPGLFIAPLPHSVNAVVVGRAPASAIVIVTEGMATRVPVDLQRAVFASLLGRFRNGGVGWTTLLYSLVWPMELFSERLWQGFQGLTDGDGFPFMQFGVAALAIATVPFVALASLPAMLWLVVFSKLFSASFTRAYRSMARSADADGMMLLKHPENAACALKTILPEDNWIPFGDRLNYLAYVRGDFAFAIGAEERDRLEQLSSLVGEPTIDAVRITPLAPALPDVANPVTAHAEDPEVQARRARLHADHVESAKRLRRLRRTTEQAELRRRSGGW